MSAVQTLRWEGPSGPTGRTWDGYSGGEWVAVLIGPSAGYRCRWYLRVDDSTKPFVEASTQDAGAARAEVQAAFDAWCARAGLVPAAELDALKADVERLMEGMCEPAPDAPGEGKLSPYKGAGGDVPDAVARDAAIGRPSAPLPPAELRSLVDAAASAIQAVDVGIGAWRVSPEAAGRIAAAALAPALRELALRADTSGAFPIAVGTWLDKLADELGAGGTP